MCVIGRGSESYLIVRMGEGPGVGTRLGKVIRSSVFYLNACFFFDLFGFLAG